MELIAEIREHIETALREEDAAGEVAVRNVLERLGPPEDIVEAAEPEPTAAAPVRRGKMEIAAVIVMAVPVLGWLVGIVVVLISQAWSNRDRGIGIALALLPLLAVPLGGLAWPDGTGSEDVLLFLFFLVAGLPSAIYLGLRLRRDQEREVAA